MVRATFAPTLAMSCRCVARLGFDQYYFGGLFGIENGEETAGCNFLSGRSSWRQQGLRPAIPDLISGN